jgi:toxin-antitoxin system PIN domain toxin
MTAVDTNLLVYAHRRDSPWHEAARQRVRELAEAGLPWAIPWPCIHEFLSIVTSPRIFHRPTSLTQALDQVEAWIESPTLHLIGEGPGHWKKLRSTLEAGNIVAAKVHDARIHAISTDHGVSVLWSADRDFNRFHGLKVMNPLIRTT